MDEFGRIKKQIEKRSLLKNIDIKTSKVEYAAKELEIKRKYTDITLDDLFEMVQNQNDLIIDMYELIKTMQ